MFERFPHAADKTIIYVKTCLFSCVQYVSVYTVHAGVLCACEHLYVSDVSQVLCEGQQMVL